MRRVDLKVFLSTYGVCEVILVTILVCGAKIAFVNA